MAKRLARKLASEKKPFSGYKVMVRSRHPSHSVLRESLDKLPFRSVVRLGSIWEGDGKERVEVNSVDSIKTSSDKLLMKQSFDRDGIIGANWISNNICSHAEFENWFTTIEYPVVAKHRHGSRGTGNYLLSSREQLNSWLSAHQNNISNYIFEKYYDYNREYRLHVTAEGCFYTCRKMLREDTPKEDRWYRNDSNSVWILENNEAFDKPSNWDAIVAECVKALNAVGLDVGAMDVKVQSAKTSSGKVRKEPKFIILESNSAASMGKITEIKYLEMLPKLLLSKYNGNKV